MFGADACFLQRGGEQVAAVSKAAHHPPPVTWSWREGRVTESWKWTFPLGWTLGLVQRVVITRQKSGASCLRIWLMVTGGPQENPLPFKAITLFLKPTFPLNKQLPKCYLLLPFYQVPFNTLWQALHLYFHCKKWINCTISFQSDGLLCFSVLKKLKWCLLPIHLGLGSAWKDLLVNLHGHALVAALHWQEYSWCHSFMPAFWRK